MSKYLELNARNIMQPIIQRLRSGAFEIGTDHKLRVNETVVPERPWQPAIIFVQLFYF